MRQIGRNDPCPCGSGRKYKHCHLGAESVLSAGATPPPETAPVHERDGQLALEMVRYARQRFGGEWLRFQEDFDDAESSALLAIPWALFHFHVRGRRVVEWFLSERGDRLAPAERAWLEAQARSWLGIWEVQDAEPGMGLGLEDLLTGERRRVREATASRMLTRRDAVLGRVVDHEGLSLLCGIHPIPLPPLEAAEVVRNIRAHLRRGRGEPVDRLRDEALGRDLIAHWEEAGAALDERLRVPPKLQNTDGDELVFVTDRFAFDPAARAEAEALLAAMEGVAAPEPGEEDRDFVFHREGLAQRGTTARPGSTGERPDDLTVIGTATVADGVLTLETNSLRRADALRKRLEETFGERLRHRDRRRRDAQLMLRKAWERDEPSRPAEPAPAEAQALVREMKERHYADWADRPLPALGGKAAREAVRTARGRERVDALLKDIEHREARLPAAERFDVSVLRRALGL